MTAPFSRLGQRGGTRHRDGGTGSNRAAGISSTGVSPPNRGVQHHPHHRIATHPAGYGLHPHCSARWFIDLRRMALLRSAGSMRRDPTGSVLRASGTLGIGGHCLLRVGVLVEDQESLPVHVRNVGEDNHERCQPLGPRVVAWLRHLQLRIQPDHPCFRLMTSIDKSRSRIAVSIIDPRRGPSLRTYVS
jgi:hypothetical protein